MRIYGFTVPIYLPLLLGCASTAATLTGGLFAIRFKDRLHLILSFSAGALLGVVFFDLLPEAIELSKNAPQLIPVTTIMALGFIFYLILSTAINFHLHPEENCENPHHASGLGAGSLAAHSLMDGIAIGLAFKAGTSVGAVVSLAVLTHDFSDGINTVGIILRDKGDVGRARRWLILDAVAPLLGVILTLFFVPTPNLLGIFLGLFAGFFLYIGAVDLIPETHHRHPGNLTIWMTILGMLVIFAVVQFGHHVG